MPSGPPPYKIVTGRTREVRGPDALELVFVAACILAACGIATVYGLHQLSMTETTEAFTLARNAMIGEVVYKAFNGDWPHAGDTNVVTPDMQGKYVRSIKLGQKGTLTAGLMVNPFIRQENFTVFNEIRKPAIRGYLSLRPVVAGAQGYGSVLFLCGFELPPPGVGEPAGKNKTTLEGNDLPPACRRAGN